MGKFTFDVANQPERNQSLPYVKLRWSAEGRQLLRGGIHCTMLSPVYRDECLFYAVLPSRDSQQSRQIGVFFPPAGLAARGAYSSGVNSVHRPPVGPRWTPNHPPMMSSPTTSTRTMSPSDSSCCEETPSPSVETNRANSPKVPLDNNSRQSQPNSAIKFSIDSILGRPDPVRHGDDSGSDKADDASDILVNVHDFSSDEMKEHEESRAASNVSKDSQEIDCYASERYSWLQCTRYKPPKLPRSKKKEGVKKRKLGRNPRVPFTQHQVNVLEQKFRQTHYLSSVDVAELSAALNLTETRVKIWFQNRRARERRDREQPSAEREQSSGGEGGKPGKAVSSGLNTPTGHCDVMSLAAGLPGMPCLPGGAAGMIHWPSPALPRPSALAHFSAAYNHRPSAFTPLTYLGYR